MVLRKNLFVWLGAICLLAGAATPARAAFHLWRVTEIYSNSSGTLQFIEFQATSGGQQLLNTNSGGTANAQVKNLANTITNTYVFPTDLSGDSAGKRFILATAGVQAAGGPNPSDYVHTMPNNFLFTAGGTITFLSSPNSPLVYPAVPTDGLLSLSVAYTPSPSFSTATNTPQNYNGTIGQVNGVPEPTSMVLTPLAVGAFCWLRRRRSRRAADTE